MTKPLLHPATENALSRFTSKPSHAALLLAPSGAGKTVIALYLASKLLGVDIDKLGSYPYFKLLSSPDNKNISIDSVREITHFLSLRTTSRTDIARIVVIEHAQLLTGQAQNALLKTIEEPPAGTVILLTAPSELGILPTILSRVQKIALQLPDSSAIAQHFSSQGFAADDIQKTLVMSDGLPGLTAAILASDTSHPLVAATAMARSILQQPMFERLIMVDEIAGNRQLWSDVLFIIGRMADIALRKSSTGTAAAKRWLRVLAACHDAQAHMLANAQAKLVILNFMLSI